MCQKYYFLPALFQKKKKKKKVFFLLFWGAQKGPFWLSFWYKSFGFQKHA